MNPAKASAQKIHEAVGIVRQLAIDSEKSNPASKSASQTQINHAKQLLEDAMLLQPTPNSVQTADTLKKAILAIEEVDNGGQALLSRLMFHAGVEGLEGGPSASKVRVDGINARSAGPHDVRHYYLRAALLILWDKFPVARPQLIKEAQKLLGYSSAKRVRDRVRNDRTEVSQMKGRVLPHLAVARDIQAARGLTSLFDF